MHQESQENGWTGNRCRRVVLQVKIRFANFLLLAWSLSFDLRSWGKEGVRWLCLPPRKASFLYPSGCRESNRTNPYGDRTPSIQYNYQAAEAVAYRPSLPSNTCSVDIRAFLGADTRFSHPASRSVLDSASSRLPTSRPPSDQQLTKPTA